ncbi:hypothetical protein QTG54_006966 [Skeletonema marinoi]|uniref:Uncharacterized protein n=1 Tax=Skeletonema marinoi TaxID=267567 RepID=A0AAD8Y9Q1_9STRA|nr:hypothetical protein QTG54_006966 [Skeletonema marinoi]
MSSEAENAPSSSGAAMLNQPIVMDCGTATIKAGFAGGTKPKITVGTKVGRAKHQRVMPGGALEEKNNEPAVAWGKKSSSGITSYFVGSKLDEHRGAFLLEHPMERGSVVDGGWDAMELYGSIFTPNRI